MLALQDKTKRGKNYSAYHKMDISPYYLLIVTYNCHLGCLPQTK